MFEVIKRFQQFADNILGGFCFSFLWYLHIYQLVNEAIKKGRYYIHLIDVQIKKGGKNKLCPKKHRLYNGCVDLIKINAVLLLIAFNDPSGL